jgi:hypothetical protein
MKLRTLLDTPPWEWPRDAGKTFQAILSNKHASQSDRLIAAELAGDITIINDKLAKGLLSIVSSADEPETLRAKAVISLGPVLEQADTLGFEDPDDVPISERAFHNIQESLQKLYVDERIPKLVRRRILEGAVCAPQNWQLDAIKTAYYSGDRDWMLTTVFAMRYVQGFDNEILEALKNTDPEIHYEAVCAAGNWGIDGAWSHAVALVEDQATPKPLLLAAIDAVGSIRPEEARDILSDLAASDDEEIAEAANEAITMAESALEVDDEDDDLEEDGLEEDDAGKWIQ